MSYVRGASRARLPVGALVDIRVADQAKELREQASRLRGFAADSRDLMLARLELAAAKVAARRAEQALLTDEERLELAERVRVAAVERYGYDPVVCEARLELATVERTQGLWAKQKQKRSKS